MERKSRPDKPKGRLFLLRRLVRFGGVASLTLLTLLLLVGLSAEWMLNTEAMRSRLGQALAESGVNVRYERIGIAYFPVPAVEFGNVLFQVEGTATVEVERALILPDLSGIVSGNFPGRIRLVRPQAQITLTAAPPASSGAGGMGQEEKSSPASGLSSLGGLRGALSVDDGSVRIATDDLRVTVEGFSGDLRLENGDTSLPAITLAAKLGKVMVDRGAASREMAGISLQLHTGSTKARHEVQLTKLAMQRPALSLSGSFAYDAGEMTLDLSGSEIDVDGVREAALGMAGAISPVEELFSYLLGGRIPEISFQASGTSVEALGEQFSLDGVLQDGRVAVPELSLELDQVTGKVHLADWVLAGEDLSARMGKATADNGRLAIGLSEESDRFLLDLMLDADLAEAREVVGRLVDDPWLVAELEKITAIEGRGQGRLVIGETFSAPAVRLEKMQPVFTARHAATPWPVTVDGGTLDLDQDSVTFTDVHGKIGGSNFAGLTGEVGWSEGVRLDLALTGAQVELDELFPWLKEEEGAKAHLLGIESLGGRLSLTGTSFAGMLGDSGSWRYGTIATLDAVKVKTSQLPAPLTLAGGELTVDDQSVGWSKVQAETMDGTALLDGTLAGERLILGGKATLGPKILAYLEQELQVPDQYRLRPPLTLSAMRLVREKDGGVSLATTARFQNDVLVDLTMKAAGGAVEIDRLQVSGRDRDQASMRYRPGREAVELGFSGKISHPTLASILLHPPDEQGQLEGEIEVRLPVAGKEMPVAKGHLSGTGLTLPGGGSDLVRFGKLTVYAQESLLRTDVADLEWRGYRINPLRGTVNVIPGGANFKVQQGVLCGVGFTGEGGIVGGKTTFTSVIKGEKLDAATSYACLSQSDDLVTGTMAVDARISAPGKAATLLADLQGPVSLSIHNGLVKKGDTFAAILEVLNVTEIVKGRLPDLSQQGLPFHEMLLKGRLGEGTLHIDEFFMDGETLELVGNGTVDLTKQTMRIELLAAPLKTIDTVIKFIPGVNYLMGGSLVAIPLSVKGSLDNPEVRVMSASSVGKSLMNLGERTIKLPVKLLESILPGGKRE